MRFVIPFIAAAMFTIPVCAQTTAAKPVHHRLTMQQHFDQANVTHDGHLTLEQAKAGYKSVARHFSLIDQDNKGYVTLDDIHAYNKTQRALHRQSIARHDPAE